MIVRTKKISVECILLSGLLIFFIAIAATLDYHKAVNYLFGDEAVYYMMAQSFGRDLDLEYSRKDLMRVYNDGWHAGPQGVFLTKLEDGKIYYAKSFVYALLLAPFQRVFGMNGFLIVNMLMQWLMIVMGWLYLRQFNPSLLSLLVSMTFFILSAAFVYNFWLTPEIFNMFCITLGLFLWLYQREERHDSGTVTPQGGGGLRMRWLGWLFLRPQLRFYLAPIPIAIAGASKLPNILFVAPLLADKLFEGFWERRTPVAAVPIRKALFRRHPSLKTCVWAGLIFIVAVMLFYGLQYLFIGHFNQYAGDRKSFYWEFPLEPGKDVWEEGIPSSNDDYFEQAFYYRSTVLLHNIVYYIFGRFTGLLPYFCCSFLAVYYFLRAYASQRSLLRYSRSDTVLSGKSLRRIFLLLTILSGISAYIILAPSNYQGGGGAFGNRFFVNIYPGVFFLMTSLSGIGPLLLSWLVGSCFLAQVLIAPFQHSSNPAVQAFRFPYRLLPVELTLLNTLPTTLSTTLVQGEALYQHPKHKLYFFDENTADRSPYEFWVRGRSRADFAIRVFEPASFLSVTLINGPTANTVDVKVGAITQTVRFDRERELRHLVMPLQNPVPFFRSSVYPVSIRSHEGFVPKFVAGTGLNDSRFLGCRVELSVDAFDAGKLLLEQKRFKEALAEFEKTLEENPQHIYAHYYLGRAYQALKNYDEAWQAFQRSKDLLPAFQDFFRTYCWQHNSTCSFDEASQSESAVSQSTELAALLAPLRIRFEAETLLRNSGRVVDAPEASGAQQVEFCVQKDRPGFLAYGQHLALPAGEYQVRYRLKTGPAADSHARLPEIACWMDVYSGKKHGVLQKSSVSLNPSQSFGSQGFQEYLLDFELSRPAQLEFRLESTGKADIALDAIDVYPRLPIMLFQASAELMQMLGDPNDAKDLFEQIFEFDAVSPDIRSGYLESLFALQRWDEALTFIRDDAVNPLESCSSLPENVLNRAKISERPHVLHDLQETLFRAFRPAVPLKLHWGRELEFLGFSLSSEKLIAGTTVQMELFWKALADIQSDYMVSIAFVRQGTLLRSPTFLKLKRRLGFPFVNVFRHQPLPLHRTCPRSRWLPGELLREQYDLHLPPDLKPGLYDIRLTLLNALTKQPLRTMGQATYVLGDIELTHGPGMD